MDFIEQIFGISLDGGSGSLEFLLFAIPIIGLYIVYRARLRAKKRETFEMAEQGRKRN